MTGERRAGEGMRPALVALLTGCVHAAEAPSRTVDVVVARHDLWPGVPITADDLEVRPLDLHGIDPEHTFALAPDLVGRTPRLLILGNEPVREERLGAPDAGHGASAMVKPGSLAVTWRLPGATLVEPGDYLDLRVLGPKDCPFVGRTLEAIHVLAVDGNLVRGRPSGSDKKGSPRIPEDLRFLTLELTRYEAAVVAAGMEYGSVGVQIRSDIDVFEWTPAVPAPPCFPIPDPPAE